MALSNTIEFLPSVFRSATNQRFLGATMDQLFTDPVVIPLNGYAGRRFSPTYKIHDNYIPESTQRRQNYQLEPSVVIKDNSKNVLFNTGYVDLLNGIANNNGLASNHQRLFSTQSYSYNGHFDYDKFVNYYNYYWLPDGPAAVPLSTNNVPYNKSFTVTRNTAVGGYTFNGIGSQANSQLILARGGTYTFHINQPGIKFWIQSAPGTSGQDPNISTVNTRNVFGVKNNGKDSGIVTFNVPLADAQNFYTQMPIAYTIDAAVNFDYNKIQNRLLSDFLTEFPNGLDGIANAVALQNTTFVFLGDTKNTSLWTTPSVPANTIAQDTNTYASGTIVAEAARAYGWRVNLIQTTDKTDYLIQISSSLTVNKRQKVFIRSGKTHASNQFWVNDNLTYQSVPAVTATKDYLYYQDDTDPTFFGQIKLVDNLTTPINVEKDILNKPGYTAPNGVTFTNGLKIAFDSFVVPTEYANKEYYAEGVGKNIKLVPVIALTVPETFGIDLGIVQDYITINRASIDYNPWSRSNRWFHKDVVTATANYNGTMADYGPNLPGRRPIIEFDANTQLWNFGRKAKASIDYIVTVSTDAFNDYEGKSEAYIDGNKLKNNDRVVFANDYDTNILNEIYRVVIERINDRNYITLVPTIDDPVLAGENLLISNGSHKGETWRFDGSAWYQCQLKTHANQEPLFDLVDASGYSFGDTTVYPDSTFLGSKLFGYAHGTGTADKFLGFPLKYRNFNNIGDIAFYNYYDFQYDSSGAATPSTFTYTDNLATAIVNLNSGYLVEHSTISDSTYVNNWIKTVEDSNQYQIFTKFYDGTVITIDGNEHVFVQIDIAPTTTVTVPHLKVYLNNKLLVPGTEYDITMYGMYMVVTLAASTTPTLSIGDKIDVAVLSADVSKVGYYEIPKNLDYNPLNENFSTVTLGQLRNHYNKLIENSAFTTDNTIPIQDHYLKAQGGTLLQHDAPLVYAMTFLNDPTVNFVDGLNFARREYTKFKNKFLTLCSTLDNLDYTDPAASVDAILANINAVKNISFPWYYSDMVPQGSDYTTTTTYTVLNVRQTGYEINTFFDINKLSNRAVLVYVNGVQQSIGVDYEFSALSPTITFLKTLSIGDVIEIRDYSNTDGNYIPETPTKLGLYPKSVPQIYLDTTYQTPTTVLRGHDGSITPIFGDYRDDFLLELELRIYNNIKADYNKNQINIFDVVPGRFRTTDYTLNEYNAILSQNFLSWVGNNSVDYISNKTYNPNNPWTWNYASYGDAIDSSKLQGSWRAIYRHWYDTDTPNLTPWEMLGFFDRPTWWVNRYGAGPYTKGNALLWEDLEAGYIWGGSDSSAYIDLRFSRPGLSKYIPVDTAGNLLNPTQIPVTGSPSAGNFNTAYSGADFAIGEQGPTETAWRRSSDYPYAVQLTMALTQPAKYFATQYDTSRFFKNTVTGQFSNADNQKITPSILKINGANDTGTVDRTSGYINWVADNIKNIGIDPTTTISSYFSNFGVQLSYKVGGFTDTKILTVTAEQTTPGSTSSSVIIPDTNYNVYLNKSIPISTAIYSAVVVEKTQTGFAVTGYDPTTPFFTIIPSIANNKTTPLTVNDITIKLYQENTKTTQTIPYGTVFATLQQVADFLVSYERYLLFQGFSFTSFDKDLNTQRDWTLSIREMLYWAQQGWTAGTIIVLNPVATSIKLKSVGSIVDEITNVANGSKVLDQNFLPIKNNDFTILRTENATTNNTFSISTLNGSMIAYAKLKLVQYEHVLIFDNVDDFNDIIYIPSQGTRQFRLKLSGYKTAAWTGALSAPGFIYNDPAINQWNSSVDYRLGDIVKYNNFYYTATQDIPASLTFNSIQWTQVQKNSIQTGLLPNFGLNAGQFKNIYDIDSQPINENLQNYSAGLIGFRQRQYLTDLGISIPTQTKFYQGFIKEKGSMNSINALTKATFNNVQGNINVYEEWAFRTGLYGGVNNNTYKEFVLDQSVLSSNPATFTSSDLYDAGNLIVQLNGNALSTDTSGNLNSNVYTSSNVLTTSTVLYSNRTNTTYINDIPTVGYMNLQDIKYTIYDINDINPNTIPVDSIGLGDKVWVAKNGDETWAVLRASGTYLSAVSLTYTLDSYGSLKFNNRHNFVKDDLLILKDFNKFFNGVYKVQSVPDSTSIIIAISTASPGAGQITPLQELIRVLTVAGQGIVYLLESARVKNVTELINKVPPLNGWIDNDYVWVDETDNGWGVYEHSVAWRANAISYLPGNTGTGGQFGTAVAVNKTNNLIYVGNPGAGNVQIFNNTGAYISTITNSRNSFGSFLAVQGNLLAVSAPSVGSIHLYRQDDTVVELQTLYNTGGNAITISTDQQWIYSSDIINSVVNAYTPGNVTYLNLGLGVTVYAGNTITQSDVFGFTQATGTVAFTTTSNIVALRDINGTFVSNVGDTQFNETRNTYIYNGTANLRSNVSTISTGQQYLLMSSITGTGGFGTSLVTNSDGSKLIISDPLATNVYDQNGNVYVYARTGKIFTKTNTLSSQYKNQAAHFGASLATDSNGGNLYIGIPGSTVTGQFNGAVERWIAESGSYMFDQQIAHPFGEAGAFGSSLQISQDAQLLAVGSQGSASQERTVFDNNYTVIDATTTQFVDHTFNSGTIYLFEPLVDPLTNSAGKYIYTQELEAPVNNGDLYGSSIDIGTNIIVAGSPGFNQYTGAAYLAKNNLNKEGWRLVRQQQPVVDINSISRTFIYNKSNNNILAALDYIDPAKGKILNSVGQDIDYQVTKDPALYNQGTGTVNIDLHWGPQQVGQIWWDLSTVRYINYEQDTLTYRLNHWGEMFPGSSIDVYQWVESSTLPSAYAGPGIPLHADDSSYSTYGYVDANLAVQVKYYFWVKNVDITDANKNNSIVSITSAIENPQAQGIPYAQVLRNDTVSLYNINNLLVGQNSVVHLGNTNGEINLIHSEYALVQEGNPTSTLPTNILNKLTDSLSGVDAVGNPVPDPKLPVSQRYGISIRPRQTMIVDRLAALNNYLSLVNQYLINYPVISSKVLTTLNSEESIPSKDSNKYDLTVDTVDQLGYINTNGKAAGFKVLVNSDANNLGKWTIYTLNSTGAFDLTNQQNYKTNLYWNYVDYYNRDLYDPTVTTTIAVADRLALGKLTPSAGQTIKVKNNGNNQFEVYLVDSSLNLVLVGIQNGTIQISTGAIPGKELRQILLAMQRDIFVDDTSAEYNTIFFSMIKYILTEQKNLDWVFKTSFVGATQAIRKLKEFPAYIPDNQNFYLDYIDEVKPYRTVVREFIVDYIGDDHYFGDITDFDLPPYYDANLSMYRSPSGAVSTDAAKLSAGIYKPWNDNHTYRVTAIKIENSGAGYVAPPKIVITGGGGTGATAYVSRLTTNSGIASIVITDPGSGYTSAPKVEIQGSNDSASASAILNNVYNIYDSKESGHNLVRSIESTVRFDRVTYTNTNTVIVWNSITTANVGQTLPADTIINLDNILYQLANSYTIDSNISFPVANVKAISSADFNNANDRIVAYHEDIILKNIGDGLSYPGVIVDGNTYVGNNTDTTITNYYTSNIGINPTDILIDGGEYVNSYSSHAPEELIPGRMFDALNVTIYDTDNLGIRIFESMYGRQDYYRIAGANTTVLSSNLNLFDSNIYVTNASILPDSNPAKAVPGIVFINGEKISYYVRDVENNRLGQIRRSVDGTSPSKVHLAGTRVIDSSLQQQLPYTNLVGLKLKQPKFYKIVDPVTISYNLRLTSKITASIGDIITQLNANSVVTGTFRSLENIKNSANIAVSILAGESLGLPQTFDDELGYDPGTNDGSGAVDADTANTIPYYKYINGSVPTYTSLPSFPAAANQMFAGRSYKILSVGTTNWTELGAGSSAEVLGNITNGIDYLTGGTKLTANTALDPLNGNLTVGTYITGSGISSGTYITAVGPTLSPYLKTYTVNNSQYVTETAITGQPHVGTVFTANATGSGTGIITIPDGAAYVTTTDNHTWIWSADTNSFIDAGVFISLETFDNTYSPIYINGILPYIANDKNYGAPVEWTPDTDFPVDSAISYSGSTYVTTGNVYAPYFANITTNITTLRPTICYILRTSVSGKVDVNGNYLLQANSLVKEANIWYNPGSSTATDGRGLINSTTAAATFLKASRSFIVPSGSTP